MPKYYVQTGQMKYVVDKPNSDEAIICTLKHFKGKGLVTHSKICVSEFGWGKRLKCYDTDEFLKEINNE